MEHADKHAFERMLRREFWILTVIGGTYGFFHEKAWAVVSTINYVVLYSIMALTMSILAYTVYLLQGQLGYLSQALNIFIVGMVVVTATLTLTLSRPKMQAFLAFYDDPWSFCEYSRNEYFENLMLHTVKKKNKLILTWAFLYGLCGAVGVCQPVIDKIFGRSSEITNVNGAWLNLPIIFWWPFDPTESTLIWMVPFMLQSLFLGYSAIVVASAVSLCFATADLVMDQFKLVIYGINNLDNRAKEMYKKRFPGSDMKRMDNREYDDCYYDCLVQNVKHHVDTLKWMDKFNDMASLPVAVPFFGGAVLIGMALITITEEDDPRLGPKCLAAMSAFSELYNMYLLCKLGQEWQQLSDDLLDALYGCRWSGRSERVKKAIRIMRLSCARPMKFTAAKLLVLNMQLFSDLINSAYSIFNLKAVSQEKES
uniref:Odorant receptor n=1 Tax=Adelphocoris lineolatus TaxID=236346 RepID=A0A2I4PH08_ADELI|nr:olfactory receptor 9 [Adelphocoris lineolatus]